MRAAGVAGDASPLSRCAARFALMCCWSDAWMPRSTVSFDASPGSDRSASARWPSTKSSAVASMRRLLPSVASSMARVAARANSSSPSAARRASTSSSVAAAAAGGAGRPAADAARPPQKRGPSSMGLGVGRGAMGRGASRRSLASARSRFFLLSRRPPCPPRPRPPPPRLPRPPPRRASAAPVASADSGPSRSVCARAGGGRGRRGGRRARGERAPRARQHLVVDVVGLAPVPRLRRRGLRGRPRRRGGAVAGPAALEVAVVERLEREQVVGGRARRRRRLEAVDGQLAQLPRLVEPPARARGARGRRAGRRGGGGRPGAARVVGQGVVEDGAVVVERVPEVREIVLLGGGAPVVAAPAPRREARGEVVEIPGVHRGRERVVLRRRDGRTSVGWGVGGNDRLHRAGHDGRGRAL